MYIYTADTFDVNRLASQICHNRLFRKKLQQNLLQMISTEVSSLATHNRSPGMRSSTPAEYLFRRKPYRVAVGLDYERLRRQAGHLAVRFMLAVCYPPCSPSRHELCPEVELAHHVLHAVREN
jgi:hypothetical protein